MTWFEKSKSFEKNAENALKMKLYDIACFSCQQAVELYLKGQIIAKSGSKPYTHSLVELLNIIEKLGHKVPDDILKCAKELGEHYSQSRYPDARITDYEADEAENAMRCMAVILNYAKLL
jgi:HEPN domain-containing protein